MACDTTEIEQNVSDHDFTLLFRLANNQTVFAGLFTVGGEGIDVCKASMTFLTRIGTAPDPDEFHVEIYTNNAGPDPDEPNAQIGGNSDAATFTDIPGTPSTTETEIEFTWSSGLPSLSASTVYWLVVKADWTLDNARYCSARYGSTAGLYAYDDATEASWTVVADDTPVMKIYKETGAPPAGGVEIFRRRIEGY